MFVASVRDWFHSQGCYLTPALTSRHLIALVQSPPRLREVDRNDRSYSELTAYLVALQSSGTQFFVCLAVLWGLTGRSWTAVLLSTDPSFLLTPSFLSFSFVSGNVHTNTGPSPFAQKSQRDMTRLLSLRRVSPCPQPPVEAREHLLSTFTPNFYLSTQWRCFDTEARGNENDICAGRSI